MSYRVAIRNNATGEIRFCDFATDFDAEADHFLWTDGNYCCDCNLSLFWHEAGGHELTDEEQRHFTCDTHFFDPLYAELPDGTRVVLQGD